MDALSASPLGITTFKKSNDPEKFNFNSERWEKIKKNYVEGNIADYVEVLTIFGDSTIPHPTMQVAKELCYKVVETMVDFLEKDKDRLDLINRVCNQCRLNGVFSQSLSELICASCRNGTVLFNKPILELSSPYMWEAFHGRFKKTSDKEGVFSVDLKQFSTNSVNKLKDYYYQPNFKLDLGKNNVEDCLDFCALVHLFEHQPLLEMSYSNLEEIAHSITEQGDLENFINHVKFSALYKIDEKQSHHLVLLALSRVLVKNGVSFACDGVHSAIYLSLNDLYLLNETGIVSHLLNEYTTGVYINTSDEEIVRLAFVGSQNRPQLMKKVCVSMNDVSSNLAEKYLKCCKGIEFVRFSASNNQAKGFDGFMSLNDEEKGLIEIRFYQITEMMKKFPKIRYTVGVHGENTRILMNESIKKLDFEKNLEFPAYFYMHCNDNDKLFSSHYEKRKQIETGQKEFKAGLVVSHYSKEIPHGKSYIYYFELTAKNESNKNYEK